MSTMNVSKTTKSTKKINKYLIASVLFLFVIQFMSFGQGSTYTGTYTNSSSLQYSNKSNFVIEGLEIGNVSNHCITLSNCQNVVIRNCKLGPTPSRLGVYLYGCSNVTVTNCTFENVASHESPTL